MALIRATCSDCGDVELRSRDLRVRTCESTDEATYLFYNGNGFGRSGMGYARLAGR